MDAATILADVQLALTIGEAAYKLGMQAGPFLVEAYQIAFQQKVLTADERAEMQAKEAQMRAAIDAAISADDALDKS
jgi:hypothetical protein